MAEIAGVVLGVLPLLISAAEHYEGILKPFKRYRQFAPELELYRQKLGTQKTIFRNECLLLLAALTDHETARNMLKESKHPSWFDPDLDEQFARQLGDSGSACKTIIDMIQLKLKEIEGETENFGHAIQQSFPPSSIQDKTWRSRVAKKLKFSLSDSRLELSLEGLRSLNQDLRTLALQTTSLGNIHQQSYIPFRDPSRSDPKVKECRVVQKVSTLLYTALGKACQIHQEHSAHFRLESQPVSIQNTGLPLVRFILAFAHQPNDALSALEPVWITVDSTIDEASPESLAEDENTLQQWSHKTLENLSNSLKRNNPLPCESSVKRIKVKSVSFATTSPCVKSSIKSTLVASFLADTTLPDFCVQHNLCQQLQRSRPKAPLNKHIGYLEKDGPCKHLVYFAPPTTSCGIRQTTSLAQIVSFMSQKSQADKFLEYERLRLARQLAATVLQFHATPLLKTSWRSDDIVFFDSAASSASLTSPHLNVQVHKPSSRDIKGKSVENIVNKESQSFARNSYLFSLGIILIELAYQAPLSSLRIDQDLINGQESKHTDFFIADRVSKSMSTSLGVNYAKVVRKCLGCDFGEGTADLSDPSLQATYYKDVVLELERLERAFVMLQLGT